MLTRSHGSGEPVFRAGRFDVPRSVRGVVSRSIKRWAFTASGDLRTGYPTTVPVAQYEIGDPLDSDTRYLYRPYVNNGRLPAYFRIDLTAEMSFELLGADWRARLHLYNVTNHRNVIARQYLPGEEEMVEQNRRGVPILPLFEIEMRL